MKYLLDKNLVVTARGESLDGPNRGITSQSLLDNLPLWICSKLDIKSFYINNANFIIAN